MLVAAATSHDRNPTGVLLMNSRVDFGNICFVLHHVAH